MSEENLVVIFMGSEKDYEVTKGIRKKLSDFDVPYEVHALSAHKLPNKVLSEVEKYDELEKNVIYIVVAGRSNALGPVISANSINPVINCPPLGSFNEDIFSSLRMPSAVPCSTILVPENAALHAVKILAQKDDNLKEEYINWRKELTESLVEKDRQLRGEL
mgnify:CR=1 FL=1